MVILLANGDDRIDILFLSRYHSITAASTIISSIDNRLLISLQSYIGPLTATNPNQTLHGKIKSSSGLVNLTQ